MATISSNDISPEVADELLRFLDDARKPEDIAGKEPQAGPVYEGPNPEPCGIRYGGNSDPLHLAYWVRGSTDKGEYSVDRIAPDDKKGVAKGAIAGAEKAGESIARCVKVFDVKDVERPGRLSDLNLNSKLRPFTEREKYRVKLGCTNVDGKPYSRAVEVPVLDCNLMLLCYNFGYNKAGLGRFPTGIPENKLSFRMFAAKLGENGARALCDQYIKDAAGGKRHFYDYHFAASVSAVLAEEFFKAYVDGSATDQEWKDFFDEDDVLVTEPQNHSTLRRLGEKFGKAHLGAGLRKTIAVTDFHDRFGPQDLFKVAKILIDAQKRLFDTFKFRFWEQGVLSYLSGITAQAEFAQALKNQMVEGLKAAGKPEGARDLKALFNRR